MTMKSLGDKSQFLVGSQHKTGTVWLAQIMGDLCHDTGRHFINVSFRGIGKDDFIEENVILFDHYSKFSDPENLTEGMTGFTIIRHPKDQIISATRYHQVSSEDWLHVPKDEFDGMTYQEKINSIDGWENKVLFEMQNASIPHTFNQIEHDPRLMRIKYEDMISGYPRPHFFDELFDYINLDDEDRDSFEKNYLKNHIRNGYKSDHVIDGSINQKEKYWTDKCESLYQRIYGDIAEQLGYN